MDENEVKTPEPEVKTFTEEEVQKLLQSETDKRVSQALEKERAKTQEAITQAVTEAKKMEQLSAEEKAKVEFEKRLADLEERESKLQKSELLAQTKSTLAEKGLPTDLAENLVALGDGESILKSIDVLANTISEQVSEQVKNSLKTPTPKESNTTPKLDPIKSVLANDPKYKNFIK